ncbi:MAG: hypothetical protein IRZ14_19430 [Chloroflexi bacterium]|mgnify:CR=1 FL=1|nr:hypothetical protein [Chloroflexota bacterium]
MRLARLLAAVALGGIVTAIAAPSASAWNPQWIQVGPVTVTVSGAPPLLPPISQPLPLPVLVSTQVLPSLQQFLPPTALQQQPLQVANLPSGRMALSHPLLFCPVDSAATCEELAQQLAEVTPGWSTATMNGPQGYGVYLTYQAPTAQAPAPAPRTPFMPSAPGMPPSPFTPPSPYSGY